MAEDFVDMCAVCKQGVPRETMVYQKGRVFHQQCFTDHGSSFATPDPELNHLSAKTRVELVQLKNLKARAEIEKTQKRQAAKPKKKSKKAAKKRPKPKKSAAKKAKKAKPKKKSKKAAKKRRR